MPNSAENTRDEVSARRNSGKGGRARAVATSAFTTETLLDIVERLGVVDLVTSRIRQRLEEVDLDEVFDEIGEYVRRNPEVLVVALATITVSAGLIVYLNSRDEFDADEAPVRVRRSRK